MIDAHQQDQSLSRFLPITLPSYPSCQNCIAWSANSVVLDRDHDPSDDDIAVAGGEHVHIISPRSAQHKACSRPEPTDQAQRSVISLPVNKFTEHEWPQQRLATVSHLSLGEEQSESVVVGLEWSPAGVGIHRRSVLAVLTSNLLLSLWETDGANVSSSRGWRRTCVVNHFLRPKTDNGFDSTTQGEAQEGRCTEGAEDRYDQEGYRFGRRAQRVRAFTWSPPLQTPSEPKWGACHLLVADDNSTITMFGVKKQDRATWGSWDLEVLTKCRLPPLQLLPGMIPSRLQQIVNKGTPVSQMSQQKWMITNNSSANPTIKGHDSTTTSIGQELDFKQRVEVVSRICITRGERHDSMKVKVFIDPYSSPLVTAELEAEIQSHEPESNLLHSEPAKAERSLSRDIHTTLDVEGLQFRLPKSFVLYDHKAAGDFSSALQPMCEEYDKRHLLGGECCIRFWGAAISSDRSRIAGVVTLHPADMVEYTTPATERSILVFEELKTEAHRSDGDVNADDGGIAGDTEAPESLILRRLVDLLQEYWTALRRPWDLSDLSSLDKRVIAVSSKMARHISTIPGSLVLQVEAAMDKILKTAVSSTQNTRSRKEVTTKISMADATTHVDSQAQTPTHAADDVDGINHFKNGLDFKETCEICNASILAPTIDHTHLARCASGHQFSRCGISFLAIQEPGISKFCSRCDRQFLDLARQPELINGPETCLVKRMFEDFDICPYCQGKFRS